MAKPKKPATQGGRRLRSQLWFDNPDNPGMTALYIERYLNYGLTSKELRSGKPIVGIAQTGSDLSPCNRHHIELAHRVREGIRSAGGIAFEFPMHPIQETGKRPTAALDRNLAYLGLVEVLYGYPIDGVVLNRLLPRGAVEGDFMQRLAEMQAGYRQEVHDIFAPLPIWEAQHYPRDVKGIADLTMVGRELFGENDPTKVFYRGSTQEIVKEGEEYIMRLPLPHVEIGKVAMTKRGDELFIAIGNFKRDMILPLTLAERPAKRAVFKNGVLEIRFGTPEVPQPAEAPAG